MISFLTPQALSDRSIKVGGSVRQHSAQQGIADEEALEKGMEKKCKEFAVAGFEIYVPA